MKHFVKLICLLVLFSMGQADAATRFEVKQMVMEEAIDTNVPVSLALAVAKVESDFNPKALSSAGARGVMQIMPKTARDEFGVSPRRLWEPEVNIRLGVEFLEQLYDQYDGRWELALSHYNGGTVKGNRPHSYTRKYIAKVQKWQKIYQEQANLWEALSVEENAFDEKEDFELVDFREWRYRGDHGDWRDEGSLRDDFEDDWPETRIIIVERQQKQGWRRPPPPPFGGWKQRPPRPRHFH
ncbi:lytic transglycosylase domain-containing protein [Terasakiella sp. SH-1]|uniref:lytic transglycosylase domain-containing protein n=1 Tax=Terasakiella sp. SH-1 TaxID=2560057 RepID=UPI001072FC35|nr:lytic transglycosylase domain-containing protein [Terasakiella sp. SH-1]